MQINLRNIWIAAFISISFSACSQQAGVKSNNKTTSETMDTFEIKKSDEDWRKQLSPVQFNILREKGTERPFTGEYDKFYEEGTFFLCRLRNRAF